MSEEATEKRSWTSWVYENTVSKKIARAVKSALAKNATELDMHLATALEKQDYDAAQVFIQQGANVNAMILDAGIGKSEKRPLLFSCLHGFNFDHDAAELLRANGCDMDARDYNAKSIVHQLWKEKDISYCKAQNIPLDETIGRLARTTLMDCIRNKNCCFEWSDRSRGENGFGILIDAAKNINAKDFEGNTAWHFLTKCAKEGYLSIEVFEQVSRKLIAKGANPEIKNNDGKTIENFEDGRYDKNLISETTTFGFWGENTKRTYSPEKFEFNKNTMAVTKIIKKLKEEARGLNYRKALESAQATTGR